MKQIQPLLIQSERNKVQIQVKNDFYSQKKGQPNTNAKILGNFVSEKNINLKPKLQLH